MKAKNVAAWLTDARLTLLSHLIRKKMQTGSPSHSERLMMPSLPTLSEREKELQILLATPAGQKELQELASRYHLASGKMMPSRTSVITYILVHERERGLIRR